MRRTRRSSGFLTCLIINLLLNFEGSIPAWICLALHLWIEISILWFVGALLLWILCIILGMKFMGWATSVGNIPDPVKENKNPYSVRSDRP